MHEKREETRPCSPSISDKKTRALRSSLPLEDRWCFKPTRLSRTLLKTKQRLRSFSVHRQCKQHPFHFTVFQVSVLAGVRQEGQEELLAVQIQKCSGVPQPTRERPTRCVIHTNCVSTNRSAKIAERGAYLSHADSKLSFDGKFGMNDFWLRDWINAPTLYGTFVQQSRLPPSWALTSPLQGAMVTLQSAGLTPEPLCAECETALNLNGGQPICPNDECPKVRAAKFPCHLITLFVSAGGHDGPGHALCARAGQLHCRLPFVPDCTPRSWMGKSSLMTAVPFKHRLTAYAMSSHMQSDGAHSSTLPCLRKSTKRKTAQRPERA